MPRAILQSVLQLLAIALLLFGSAGRLDWPQAWAFLALFALCGAAMTAWLLRRDPGLVAERTKSPFSADQRPRDRAVMAGIMTTMIAWTIVLGLDARFGWSSVPVALQVLGAVLVVVAFLGWVPVLGANSFASVAIRVQREREQRVISTGPYGVVRHPMYSFALVFLLGLTLLLGSWWGLLGFVPLLPLVAARALGEEAVLLCGLPGYRDYTTRVRYRLVPGLW